MDCTAERPSEEHRNLVHGGGGFITGGITGRFIGEAISLSRPPEWPSIVSGRNTPVGAVLGLGGSWLVKNTMDQLDPFNEVCLRDSANTPSMSLQSRISRVFGRRPKEAESAVHVAERKEPEAVQVADRHLSQTNGRRQKFRKTPEQILAQAGLKIDSAS